MICARVLLESAPLLLAALCTAAGGGTGTTDAKAQLVVRGGRVFDGTGKPAHALGAIVVRNGRIDAILAPGAPLPDAERVIDAEGCTVLPGLFDLHVHVGVAGGTFTTGLEGDPSERLEQHLYCGVTSVLDLHGVESTIFALRDASRSSDQMARLYVAGAAFTVPKGHGTQFGIPANEVSSTEDVDRRFAGLWSHQPPDVIKAILEHGNWGGLAEMPTLTPELLASIASHAKKHSRPLFVHVWTRDEALLATKSGARALAHGVFADSVDDELIGEMKAHGTAYVPTLSVVLASTRTLRGEHPYDHALVEEALHPDLAGALSDPDLKASLQWSPMAKMDEHVEERALSNLRAVAAAGLEIGVGTDAGNPLVPHGVSVPLEIGLYVEAGLTPLQALRAATLGSAHILGVEKDYGSIERDKVADLAIIRGDPTAALGDRWNVRDVVKAGVVVDRKRVAARNLARARPAKTLVAGSDVTAELDGFEDGDLVSSWGGTWTAWSDRVTNLGTSDGQLDVAVSDATKSLEITGQLTKDFAWGAWAGASLQFDPDKKVVVDASRYHGLKLRVRGTPRPVSITVRCAAVKDFNVFSAALAVKEEWAEVEVPFEALHQIGYGKTVAWTGKDLTGVNVDARNTFGGTAVLGDFRIEIDWIRLY